jgi:hypothetical protein
MKITWFTYAMDGHDPIEFDTKRDAVKSAQAELGTDRRPVRLENGMYFLNGGRGQYSRYIGTAKSFDSCGYAWACAQLKVGRAAAGSVAA